MLNIKFEIKLDGFQCSNGREKLYQFLLFVLQSNNIQEQLSSLYIGLHNSNNNIYIISLNW